MVSEGKIKFRLTRINSIKTLEVSTEMQKCIFLPLTKKINNLEFSKRKFYPLKIQNYYKWEISTAIET